MLRDPESHKGENGRIAIIGGSALIHGAPILCALAAEASGTDLVTLCLPRIHAEAAKMHMLNAFVHPFASDDLSEADTEILTELLATLDVAVIGPGLARTPAALSALADIIAAAPCPLVLDASALQPTTLDAVRGKPVVLTPHLGELERMGMDPDTLSDIAVNAGITILLKGAVDLVAEPDGTLHEVEGGNAGLTAGGTGDVLAGLIGGLIAQGVDPSEAALLGSRVMKQAATELYSEYGYAYGARRVIDVIPRILHGIDS